MQYQIICNNRYYTTMRWWQSLVSKSCYKLLRREFTAESNSRSHKLSRKASWSKQTQRRSRFLTEILRNELRLADGLYAMNTWLRCVHFEPQRRHLWEESKYLPSKQPRDVVKCRQSIRGSCTFNPVSLWHVYTSTGIHITLLLHVWSILKIL